MHWLLLFKKENSLEKSIFADSKKLWIQLKANCRKTVAKEGG